MKTIPLMVTVLALALAVGLVATNPSTDDYLVFVEAEMIRTLDRMDQSLASREQEMIRSAFRSQRKQLIESVVRPHTRRHNWGVMSWFETNTLGVEVVVLGVAGQFVPLRGVEDVSTKVGRLVF